MRRSRVARADAEAALADLRETRGAHRATVERAYANASYWTESELTHAKLELEEGWLA